MGIIRHTTSNIILVILGASILFGLGTWQIYRLEWKTKLLVSLKSNVLSKGPLYEGLSLEEQPEFSSFKVKGVWEKPVFFLVGKLHEGKLGFHSIQPFTTSSHGTILINTGWVPGKAQCFLKEGRTTITGSLRFEEPSWRTPPHVTHANEWGRVDPVGMGEAIRKNYAKDFYFELQESGINQPFPAPIRRSFQSIPNNHLGYALTWFFLCLLWAVGGTYLLTRQGHTPS